MKPPASVRAAALLEVLDAAATPAVAFTVPGVPGTAGSKRAFVRAGRAVIVDACRRHTEWRAHVRHAASAVHGGPLLDGPLVLVVAFRFARPAGHYGRRGLRPTAPPVPWGRPDTTKLLRALEDALTGVLWVDDARIVDQYATKRYADAPGADVAVYRWEAIA